MQVMTENATVLLADAEPAIQTLVKTMLQGARFDVLVARDPEETLKLIGENGVDVALIDSNLSEDGGIAVAREVLDQHPDVVIALLTTTGAQRSALSALKLGIDRYLIKPFEDPALVRRLVTECLSDRKARLKDKLALEGDGQEGEETDEDQRIRVIVADPNDEDRAEVREALANLSCEIKEATCGQEALLLLSRGPHDVLVVSYDMDDMTADDVLLRAKRLDDKVAVVVTASEPSLKMTTSLIKRGAAGFIEKPLKDPARTASAIVRQGLSAQGRREAAASEGEMDWDENEEEDNDEGEEEEEE